MKTSMSFAHQSKLNEALKKLAAANMEVPVPHEQSSQTNVLSNATTATPKEDTSMLNNDDRDDDETFHETEDAGEIYPPAAKKVKVEAEMIE